MGEVLARQYILSMAAGVPPKLLADNEMSVVKAQSKSYVANGSATLTDFEKKHALRKPRFAGSLGDCCEPSPTAPASFLRPPTKRWAGWKRALDEELRAAKGQELPWQALQVAVVTRFRLSGEADAAT